MPTLRNFGRNVTFSPGEVLVPNNEEELIADLQQRQPGETIRVVGSFHSWSDLVPTEDVIVCLRHFREITIDHDTGTVSVGAGCQIKRLLAELNRHGLTLPSIGLITEQTVAGAIATGTHGSGKNSLSHFVRAATVVTFRGGEVEPVRIDRGDELRAIRCSLGALGILTEITFPVVRQYCVEETVFEVGSVREAVSLEADFPLQQFFLLPHCWRWYTQSRRVAADAQPSRGRLAYRLYWFAVLDVGMHLLIQLAARALRSPRSVRLLFRSVIPRGILRNTPITDRSDRMLVMEHELFRHFELELFVPEIHLEPASGFVEFLLRTAAGESVEASSILRGLIEEAGLWDELRAVSGTYTHHYPICFRKVLRDDTLISMSAGKSSAWYSISLITYVRQRESFCRVAALAARIVHHVFDGRIHWGKWYPFTAEETEDCYSALPKFREIANRFDPEGNFRNCFLEKVMPTE